MGHRERNREGSHLILEKDEQAGRPKRILRGDEKGTDDKGDIIRAGGKKGRGKKETRSFKGPRSGLRMKGGRIAWVPRESTSTASGGKT